MSIYDPPEPPIQFVNDDEICEHEQSVVTCLECKEDELNSKNDLERKDY